MDPVTTTLVRECIQSQQIKADDPAVQFEHFVNFVVLSDLLSEDFDLEGIATGAGEFGIDGIAIIVNDTLVEDEEQFNDLASSASTLRVKFIFTQAKTSSSFDTGDISKFLLGVEDFFGVSLAFQQNARVMEAFKLKNAIYAQAAKFNRGLPALALYYATVGQWVGDKNLCAARDIHLQRFQTLHMFDNVAFEPLDATKIQKLYFQTRNSFKADIDFQNNVALPPIEGVREAYIGVLSLAEFKKMITDDGGDIRKKLFSITFEIFRAIQQ